MDDPRLDVRPLLDSDDLDELHVGAPGWFGEASLRRIIAANEFPSCELVGLVDGVPAGFGYAVGAGVADGHRGIGWVFVRPSSRRLGVGRLLWAEILKVCTPERVPGLTAVAGEDDATTQEVALAHGMSRAGLHLESRLDLRDLGSMTDHVERRVEGISIRPLPPDATAAQWREFAELFWKLALDVPDQAAGTEQLPEPILRSMLQEPWQVMGAWAGERLVGFTSVSVTNPVQRALNTFLTAIERDHRGRGLSTLLKASHATALAEAGWTVIVTQNMEGNEPILAANRRLGFEPTGGLRDLVYDF